MSDVVVVSTISYYSVALLLSHSLAVDIIFGSMI
jgi:hypothetical protein